MDDDRRRDHKGAVKHGTHDDSVNHRSSMFELRLVTLDHYLAAPSAPLDPLVSKLGGWEVWQVPVLRIFGVTPAGQKACLHVHGVLPYLTVPCTEPRPERFAVVLASEIDLLLNTAAGRATSMHRHVHHVAVFRGMRLYGFHDREETFLRIYLYNPHHVPKVAELLLSGHVLKQVMQPHEAHIPYSLQFMVDHNLHGMSFVRVESFKFRRPLSWAHDDRSKALGSGPGIWSLRNLPVEQFGDLEKQTTCELELDCCAKDIANASEKEALNPGLAALWQEEEDRRQEPVSWAPLSLEDDGFPPTESERFYLARLDKLLTRPTMDEQELTGSAKQSRKKHHSRLLDTSHGILDSQDEALAEALAQAASSWHQGANEEQDSILGSLPGPDDVVDEEDDNDVEDMSQVFQLAGEREQDNDGDSSMSDHSDGNEAYDPFQLDGADDRPAGASGTVATTRDQGTQTGARPPVLVRRLLGRARARRCTRLSLQRQQQQQQQQNSQLRKPEQSPAKSAVPDAGPEACNQKEVPGSSPLVAEDWQRWQSCHVASMLMAPLPGDGAPSGGESSPAPSLSPKLRAGRETSSCLLPTVQPCSVELSRLTDEEIAWWQQRREPEGRRRWRLRQLDVHGQSCASPVEDMSEPKKQRRKRVHSTDSSVAGSTSSQRSALSVRKHAVSVNSVLPHAEGYTESEVCPVEVDHRTRRVSYSSLAGDSEASSRHVKAGTRKASKRVKATNDSASARTLRERDIGEKADKGQVRVCVTGSGDNAESSVLAAAAAAAGLGSELNVPLVEERAPHSRRGRKLSTKRRLAVEVMETVPDSDASSSSLSSSHLVGKCSDLEVSGSRPSIICRIRIQGKHGVISTTSTRQVPRVVGFVSPDRSTTESCVADLGSPPTCSASDSSSSTIVGTQMSDGPTSGATPLSSEMADPGVALRHKVSKKNKSSTVTPEEPAVHLESSKAAHMSDAPTSLATPSSSEVADSGIVLRQSKSSRNGKLSTVTPEAPATRLESSEAAHMPDVPEPVAASLSSEVADPGTTLRAKFSNSKSGTVTPEAPTAHLEDSEAAPVPDASTSLVTSLSSEVADSGVVLRRSKSSWKGNSNTVTLEAPDAHSESSEAAHVPDAPTPLATSLSDEVTDSGVVSRRLKSSRKSKSSTAAPDTLAMHSESCKAASVPDTPQSDATLLSSEVADHGVALRAKFSRKSKSSIVIPEAPAVQLESSEAVHMPDAPERVATPLRSEGVESGVALRPKRSRKSKLSTVTPEAQLESSEAAHMPDAPTTLAMSSEVADSGALLRPRSSRKSKSNTITPEASEAQLESPEASLSGVPPPTVELGASDIAPHDLPSRKSTRSASDAGTKKAKQAASFIASKPTESPEALSSGTARIENVDNHQLHGSNSRMEMGAPHANLGALQSGSDVDTIQEPRNVKPVPKRGRPKRTNSVGPLFSSPDSQGAADVPSDDNTVHCENTVRPTTRRTRRQLASSKLSSKEVSATSSSSAESVTSFSSCEVRRTNISKLVIRPSRSKVKDSNASLSLSTENVNATELGADSAVQVVDHVAKSSKSEARGRSSSRISANKLALRTKIRKEDKNEEKTDNLKLQSESCLVADTSGTPPPVSDIGVTSAATVDTVMSSVLSVGTTCSTGASTAKLVSDSNMTRQVSSGSQVTSSGTGDKGISASNCGAPEIVNSRDRLMSITSRSSASSNRREVGGLPVRSSKSRKRAGLPEAHDPGIQELLVTYEKLTITPPSELLSDGSVGSKQSNVARPSAAFNLPEAAGSSDSPRRSPSSRGTNSVEKEGTQKCIGNDEPEAEHPKELSSSSNPIAEKESGSAKSVVSSDRSEAADAGDLMRGADTGVENSPELVPALPVSNCAGTKPGAADFTIRSSSASIANSYLVAAEELETSSPHTRQCQSEVTAFDVPVSSNIPVFETTTSEPAIEPVVPEEVNGGSAFGSDLAPADTSANVNLHAGLNGPVPVGSPQGNTSSISASTMDVSEPAAKPKVSDMAGTDAPLNKLPLSSDSKNVPRTSPARSLSMSNKAGTESLTLPLGDDFDSSSLSSINSASELSRPHVASPIEQSSSELLDSHRAVHEGSATELVTELSCSIELGQRVTEGCAEQDASVTGTPELVHSLCVQKGNESQKASSDDVQFEGEPPSRICAGSKRTMAEVPSAVGSINSAEVSSVDDDFICLSPEADAEWILLDEVRDDSIELFPSPEESIAADCSERCIDHTIENHVPDSEMNCDNVGVSEKNAIGDMGEKDLVGHFDGVSSEESVHEGVADGNSIQHGGSKSRSKRTVESVCKESSIDNSCESRIGNVGSVNCADNVAGESYVVEVGSEGCSEATSSKEHFEISSADLADTSCEEILRNFGSDSSIIDLGSENFSEPTGSNKCTEEVAKEDCADISSADLVPGFDSENCGGDIGSEGMEFIASENFVEDIGSEESMELFSGIDSESKQLKDAVALNEISSDSRQCEDVYAAIAAGKLLRVAVERLEDIDTHSAIGMLYRKAKKALKYNRAPCKGVEISGDKHDVRPDNSQAENMGIEEKERSVAQSSARKSPACHRQTSRPSKSLHKDVGAPSSQSRGRRTSDSQAQHRSPREQDRSVKPSSVEMAPASDQQTSKSSKSSHKDLGASGNQHSRGQTDDSRAQHANTKKHDGNVMPLSEEKSCSSVKPTSKSSKTLHKDSRNTRNQHPEKSAKHSETRHLGVRKKDQSADPLTVDKSSICHQKASKSSKASHSGVQVFKSKGSEGSSNKTETQRAVTEKQREAVEPSPLEKSLGRDQQASKSSRDLHNDVRASDNQVQVCENRERTPDSPEERRAGGSTQQQDECAETLQMEKSLSYHQREPLPPTDVGKEPGLLDQVLDLGELPDAIKCLLDSEVPLPELDADCFSLPPDSTRWLSDDGVVEKRKPDERPQANKEEPPFCPSGDIMLGDLTKACSLTNEGLVALVPAVPPPSCGPHFNNSGSTTARVRKKCLRGLAHWQKTKLEAFARDSCFEVDFEHNPELRIAFCRDRSVVLTPARSAPTVALLAPTRQRPPPSPDDDVVSIRELPPSDASPDPTILLVSPPSTPPRHETSTSQLDGPSGRFALSGARLPADTERVLTVLSVEVHVRTRSDLRPDPAHDSVQCVLWCARGHGTEAPLEAGAMHWVLGDPRLADIEDLAGTSLHRTGVATPGLRNQVVRSELDLFHALVDLVHRWDPDVLLGYDVERASWGYLFERAEQLNLDLYARLSRAPPPPGRKEILGRILLSVWRILRKEVTLNIYTFENTYYHVMHRRVPLYSFRLLSEWFNKDLFRWRTVEHYALRARGNLELLDELNVFGKTSQMARIFGIQFLEVLSRGSQFRVESMLLRLARSHRMVALSASTAQRARQRAPEFIPLVLEPRAQLYTDPVVVLDFQSLYPSVIIAHNYCYSTCLGRVENLGSSAPFGCSSLEVPTQLVKSLRDHITVSPAGVAFVKPSIRRGLLSQMLDEVLGTRIMVKKAMSQSTNKGLRRVLDAQQLSLKLIANVTYGYTSAGFSGRMPCVEVADSVVSKGREALEHAIRTAEAIIPGARVVYGDTDSLFVLLEGRSREEAFRLGQEIADRVTAQNPRPMRLKLEKVYQPCVLQTKKRYVGFAYESPDQQEPKYDAKGIETVRRDTCPAVAKLLEKMLRVLFTSRDIVAVKRFVKLQLSKILAERVSPQDFIFAREFRGLHGYQPSACVPALEITRRQLRRDPRAEPLVGERVPYVVVYGHPGQRLIELVRSPLELLSGQLRLNAHYYVARVIGPALNRVLRLLGSDCLQWYEELPRPRFVATPRPGTMAAYVVVNQLCLACGGQAESRQLCASCEADPGYAALVLGGKVQRVQKALLELQVVCHSCMGFQAGSVCLSVDCPVLFKTSRVTTEAQQALDWNSARNSVSTTSS